MTTPITAASTRGFGVRDVLYIVILSAAVAANAIFKLDADPGGYEDRWLTIDKMVHFAVAYATVLVSRMLGVRQAVAVAGILAAAVAFEFTQGFVSWRDIVAGWAGAFFAAAWWLIPERRVNPR